MPPSPESQDRPPNVVVMISDDHPAYTIGADGNPLADTPHLDQLASEGVRFARNFCQYPICTPSRQSMLTGLLPHAAEVTVVEAPLSPEKQTVAKQLRSAGYDTGVIGKMHWNCRPEPPHDGLHGFDWAKADQVAWQWHRDTVADRVLEFRYFGAQMPTPPDIPVKTEFLPFKDHVRVWQNAECIPDAGYERDLRGTFLADKACEFIREHQLDPFALWVGFSEPHSPFAFPIEDRHAYRASQIELPPVSQADAERLPLEFRDLTDDEKRGIIAAHYTSVHYLDRNVGRILRTIRQLGLEDDTLVIYTSDHGAMLGNHGWLEKHTLHEEAIRTPLLMRFPRRFRGGRVVEAMTETVDLPGTILELVGAESLPVNHGRSLVALLEGRATRHRDEIFTELLENEEAAIRTERWKFIYCSGQRKRLDGLETDNPTPGRYVRLFDLEADPREVEDLAGTAQAAPIVAQMKERLLGRFAATHPEAALLPDGLSVEEQLDWFVRPRDSHYMGGGIAAMKYGVDEAEASP